MQLDANNVSKPNEPVIYRYAMGRKVGTRVSLLFYLYLFFAAVSFPIAYYKAIVAGKCRLINHRYRLIYDEQGQIIGTVQLPPRKNWK